MSDVVAPPNYDTSWCDITATAAAVRATLRLADTDPDAQRIDADVLVAVMIANELMDREGALEGPPPPATVQFGVELGAALLYRRKDIVSQPVGGTLFEDVLPSTALVEARQAMRPYVLGRKLRWGLG